MQLYVSVLYGTVRSSIDNVVSCDKHVVDTEYIARSRVMNLNQYIKDPEYIARPRLMNLNQYIKDPEYIARSRVMKPKPIY